MTIKETLDYIQEAFQSRQSMYHWLFWLHATNYCGLSSDLLLEEAAYHCLDNKQWFTAIKFFTQLFGVEHWKVFICMGDGYFLHKEGAFPIWSQGDKYYIPELDRENNFEWDSDEELPF